MRKKNRGLPGAPGGSERMKRTPYLQEELVVKRSERYAAINVDPIFKASTPFTNLAYALDSVLLCLCMARTKLGDKIKR
jgi:hypothetical protein